MKTFTMLAGLFALAAIAHAQQGFPARPLPTRDERPDVQRALERMRESELQARTSCTLPDESTHQINTVVRFEGQTYRCVEVFAPNMTGFGEVFTVRLGWIKS
jgi:hypothetical protein